MLKNILLTLVLLFSSLYAYDARLNNYPETKEWLKDADTNGESAYNIGVIYHQYIKDDTKAIKWFKKAYVMNDNDASIDAIINLAAIFIDLKEYKRAEEWYKKGISKESIDANFGLGLLYKKLHQYNDAVFYYKKAYKMGDVSSANSLGFLYYHSLKDNKNAEVWYKKAVSKNNKKAIGNLAKLYHKQNKDELGAAYLIALIDNGYSKSKVLGYLKNKWQLNDVTIQQAYKLQQTLDIPKHYTGGID